MNGKKVIRTQVLPKISPIIHADKENILILGGTNYVIKIRIQNNI